MQFNFLSALFKTTKIDTAYPKNTSISKGFEGMSLYYRSSCPFCCYVLAFLKTRKLDIELRDTSSDLSHDNELINLGGKRQVPCLRIVKGDIEQWLYESIDIVEHLKKLLATAREP